MITIRYRRSLLLNQRGFSIAELMIAATISLLVIAGVGGLFLMSSASERTNAATSDIAVNGQYALAVLRRDLLHAGYRGLTWASPSAGPAISIANECGSAGFATNLRQALWGSNDSNPFSANCIPAARFSTGDVLVLRHVNQMPAATIDATGVYFRSAYERGEVFLGSVPPTFSQSPFRDYALHANAYYVSPYTTSSTETPAVPALKRVALGATGSNGQPAMNEELVASNIEDVQFQYGRLRTDGTLQFYDANNINGTSSPSEWDDIQVVRIWVLARSSKIEPGFANTATYTLGDKTRTVSDGYRRKVFSTVVQLRNH